MKVSKCTKQNRFLVDTDWPLVITATNVKHPYHIDLSEDEDAFAFRNEYTTCPDCHKDIQQEPSPRELKEMTRLYRSSWFNFFTLLLMFQRSQPEGPQSQKNVLFASIRKWDDVRWSYSNSDTGGWSGCRFGERDYRTRGFSETLHHSSWFVTSSMSLLNISH